MINVNYWYNSQVRTIILHTLRLFANFQISEGLDVQTGKEKLRRVPVVFMATDKSVLYMLNNATDTIIESCPKMVLAIEEIKLNNNLQSGSPYYEYETSITEKKFDTDLDNYVHTPGNSYNIKRLNPLPLGITFKLYVLTTMNDQKFQLFEQIRSIFSPTLELQTSENPLDWTRVTAITLTGLKWSSRGTTNLDSSRLDSMDMTFEVNTNLDLPSLQQREKIIDDIITNISTGEILPDIVSWSVEDTSRTFYTPTNNRIELLVKDDIQYVRLAPSEKCKNWGELFKVYGIKYSPTSKDIQIHCLTNSNPDIRADIKGNLVVDDLESNIARLNIIKETLPAPEDCITVDAIIDPLEYEPSQKNGTRYLIANTISTNTKWWGELLDMKGDPLPTIEENCIIVKKNGKWTLDIDPKKYTGTLLLKDTSEPLYIYTYNTEYKMWVDYINKVYQVGFWRISEKTK
jgi:hypothetical protein